MTRRTFTIVQAVILTAFVVGASAVAVMFVCDLVRSM